MARKGDLVHTYPKGALLFSTVPAWHDETADMPPIILWRGDRAHSMAGGSNTV